MRYQAADFGFFDDREAKYSRLILERKRSPAESGIS